MTGAMYAAVSGLKAHMSGLNVIGNNIANVNTEGFKGGRYVFQSALYTSLRGGSNGTQAVGGRNPSQIGYGASLGSVDINMGTSSYVPTGRPMDCMIDGDGFFLISKTKELAFNTAQDFKSLTLTRVGDLEFKADGALSNRNGDVVYGFNCVGTTADGTPVMDNKLAPVTLPKIAYVQQPMLDADGDEIKINGVVQTEEVSIVVYNEEQFEALRTKYPDQFPDDAGITFDDLEAAEMDSVSIDPGTGKISGITKDGSHAVTIGFLAIGNVSNPNGVTQLTNTYYQCGDGAGNMNISVLGGAAAEVYDLSAISGGGGAAGGGGGATIGYDGIWSGVTVSKGMSHVGKSNPKTDANAAGDDAAPDDSMRIRTGGTTALVTSGLEQTDVDLATEISNMIFMQRGYQANTRIVSVTDSMLEELVNMKR